MSIEAEKTYKLPKIGMVKNLGFDDLSGDDIGSGVWDAEIKAFMDAQEVKGLFYNEDWVFMLLDLVAEHVSRSRMVIKKESGEQNGKTTFETITAHPALTILDNPNEFQTYDLFMYNYTVEYDLMGNSLTYFANRNSQLFIIPTETATLHFDRNGKFDGYVIVNEAMADGVTGHLKDSSQMFFRKDMVWHLRRPNPRSLLYGLSPFVPARKNVLFNRYTQDWLNSFYQKGATPTVVLSMENQVNEQSALRFLRSFEMAYTGRRNMRRPLVLPKGVSADTFSPSISDQNLVELVKLNRENIINILRVPKHALSLAESGSLGSEEHKQALKFFYSSAIIPKQQKIAAHLTRCFKSAGLLEEDEHLEFDNTEIEVLREDLVMKAELSQKLSTIWTLNEIRTEIWEKEAIEGGDNTPGAVPQLPQFAPPSQPTQEPEPEPAEDEPEEEQQKDFDQYQDKDYRDNVIKAVLVKYSDHLAYRAKQNLEIVEGVNEKTQEFWEKTLVDWAGRIRDIIKNNFHKPREKQDGVKPPGKRFMRRLFQRALEEDEEKWLDFHSENFKSTADDSYDVQIDTVVGQDNKEAIQALKERDENKRALTLQARGLNTFANISKSTTEAILDEVAKGVENQTPLRDLGDNLFNKFSQLSQKRAETIARTEALTAVSIGKQAALENTKEVIDDIVKVWINLGDIRVRGHPSGPPSEADHWSLQGETKEIDEPFTNGLMYPRDVKSNDPAEVINCRCDFLMVPREDLEDLDV